MKTIRSVRPMMIVAMTMLAVAFGFRLAFGQTAPGLSIAASGTNQVSVTITNGVTNAIYEIYYVEFLNNTNWALAAEGTAGQTNFNFVTDNTEAGFFRALNGNDFDGDGIPNYEDARPYDPGIGLMTVTIEKPANGSNVQ